MKYPIVDGGRYFLVKGRRWRCSDPTLAPEDRQAFTNELMAGWRDIARANRLKDSEALKAARSRVHRAKLALGERGPKWWEPYTDEQLETLRSIREGIVCQK